MLKILRHIIFMTFILSNVSCRNENFAEEKFLEDFLDPLGNSSFMINNDSEEVTYTNSRNLSVKVLSHEKAFKWCLSEIHFLAPNNLDCTGGQGTENGWDTISSPTNFTLTDMDGTKTLYLWILDSRDKINKSIITKTVILDRIAPIVTLNPFEVINSLNQNSYKLDGTCESGSQVDLDLGGIISSTNCTNNTWSYTGNLSAFPNSNILLKVSQVDRASNTSNIVSELLSKDTEIPVLNLTSITDGEYILHSNQASYELSGSCTKDGILSVSGSYVGNINCVAGLFSQSADLSSLVEGSNLFKFQLEDESGNKSSTLEISLTKDSVPPNLTQTLQVSNEYTNLDSVTFSGKCEEGLTIFITGSELVSLDCTSSEWSYTTENKSTDGEHAYIFTQTDIAGNVKTVNSSWFRDASAPIMTNVSIASDAAFVNTLNTFITISATDTESNLSHVRIVDADPISGDCQGQYRDDLWKTFSSSPRTFPYTLPSSTGVKKICVWVKDTLGNISTHNPSIGTEGVNFDTVTYDVGTLPFVSSLEVKNNTPGINYNTRTAEFGDQISINYSVSDLESLADNPVSLYYTTNNIDWTVIVEDYGPSGLGTTYSENYINFNSPSNSFFKIKIVVKDTQGNRNVETLSNSFNTDSWSIYAGSKGSGIGGTYNSVRLKKTTYGTSSGQVAVNPKTNDVYYISYGVGILKVNSTTGIVDYFVTNGSNNIIDGGVISSASRIPVNNTLIRFDKNGLLYIKTYGRIYRIDPVTNSIKLLFGGGTNYNSPYTANTVSNITSSSFDIDLNNNIYFYADCGISTGSWSLNTNNTAKIIKAVYQSESDEYSFTDVAGNCTLENPATNGEDSLNQGIGQFKYKHLMQLTVSGDGSVIYYGESNTYKIINNKVYSTSVGGSRGLYIDKNTNDLLVTNNGTLREYTAISIESDSSESYSTLLAASGDSDCNEDGALASEACVNIYHGNGRGEVVTSYSSDIYFVDIGPRVRYLSKISNRVYTIMGTKAIYGDGLDKQFLKAHDIGGIHYKSTSDSNQSLFPEGLYFTDQYSMTLNYINPSTNIVSTIGGDQSVRSNNPNGSFFDTNFSLSTQHTSYNLSSLAFDDDGLPWFISHKYLQRVNNSNYVERIQTGNHQWARAQQGDDPKDFSSWYYFGKSNLVTTDNGVFVIGNNKTSTTLEIGAVLQFHDYGNSVVQHIMGGGSLDNDGQSADTTIPGSTSSLTLSEQCNIHSSCFIQYDQIDDRLYFSEETRLRYITEPKTPENSTLETLFDAGRIIRNFILTQDNEQLYYIDSGGRLYCYDLPGGTTKAHCDNSSLGPSTGLSTLIAKANQLTWKSSSELLINTGRGDIYLYTLP